ncbi:MAG: DUF4214 domain-containing protein [Acidimicrobiales bacterium]|nr:DUF4214 domain-containing protein [Acidimicrobiales bacterium]
MKSKTMKAALAFLTASAAVVGFTGPASAESIEGETYSYPLTEQGASGVSGNASATVNGTNLDVVVFADNIDFDGVVMHFHTGATCDSNGAIAVSVDGSTVPVIDGRFVYEVTVPIAGADMENVYFNVHEAGNLANVLACGELALGDDPQVDPAQTTSFDASNLTINGTDIAVTGTLALQGNKLNVDLQYEGDDLLEANRHLLMLRNTNSCDPGDFTNIADDIVLSVTRTGKTDAPDPVNYTLLDIYPNSSWVPVAGAEDDPLTPVIDESTLDTLTVQTEVILSADQAAAFGSYSLVLLGSESETDTSRPADRQGLTVQETIPSNCALFTNAQTGSGSEQMYNLDFVSYNGSNIAGPAFLKNNVNGVVGSVELFMLTSANSPTDGNVYKVRFAAPDSMQCSGDIAEQKILPADNSDLGSGITGANGVLRANLTNASGYSTTLEALNNDEFTIIITDDVVTPTTVHACANMRAARLAPPETPDPPAPFDGTVAEATTIDEILAASDYRANASNTGKDQEILRLYTAFFNRETPDINGAKYWIAVSKGEAGDPANLRVYGTLELSGFFAASTEFKNTFGNVSDADFVDTVYQNVLGRPGEAKGVAYWNDILNGTNVSGDNPTLTKGTRAQVVYYVAINNEFINRLPYAPIS